jgi:amino acid adenylation domain-containing protein/non-ribosomal peptide synthase protein (TIGR01720 family)
LINSYGVSEATIDSCYFESTALDLPGEALVPIGKPFGNVQLFVLDSFLQPVPIGVPGELHVGGLGLARGYCHRSEMTRERFVDLELPTLGSVHLYKTGDLARFLPDGNLELLGRIDNQVKIRGFRIELGEVETTLLQQPAVSQAIAIAREDEPGMKRLVAYLVCDTEQKPATNDLREFLKQTLPEYMVPSAFVFIEALPLTPNGKIDRRALPAPEFRPDLEPGFIAPETEIEQRLAQIWSEVLGIKQIGIRDNFFALGGDSILSLQIITRANQAKLQLTPKQLFAHPTIAELAAVVGTGSNIRAEQGLVIGAVPLTPIQRWFFEQEQPEPHHYNQSVVLEVPANLKSDLLQRVLQQLTVHHDALRLRFDRADSGWEQRHAEPEEIVPLTVVDLSDRSSAERHAELDRIGNEMQASLNLSVGSLMQAVLFRLGSDVPGRLLLIVHHLAIDGVSWRILLEDLLTAYQQCDCGETIHLPLKTTSFQYWARQLTEYARSNALAAELDYWLEQTDRQFASLPTDNPTGANTVASATTISVFLDTEETQVLLHEVPKAYNTQMNDILLAALVLAINQQTGDRGIRLDLEGHGREDLFDEVDLSRTVGWFTTLFPVVLELEDAASPQDVLKSVKEQLRGIPNKGMGYSLLRYLSPDPSLVTRLRNAPPAEICFNYLGQFEQSLDSASGFRLTTDSFGSAESPHRLRSHLLDINGFIVGDRLQIDWTYSSNLHQAGTIDRLARAFIQQLRSLISHCISPNAGGYTPSDFPLAKLNQVQLDRITFGLHGNSRWQDLEDLYPLSPTQQGMLFHSLLEPDSGVYVELFSCTLRGRLNLPAFERAWRQTIARHTIFRTAFLWQHEQPLQVVYRNIDLPLDVQNWTALTPEVQQRQIEDLLESEGKQGFDLALAPLMRLHLIQLNDEAHQFVWSHHHILLDGWSLPLVLKEVFDRYDAICTDTALPSETAVAYRKYIAWLQQQDANKAQTYWQQKLQGFIAPTPIDVKQPYSDRQPHEGYGAEQLELSSETATALRSFARQHQLTLNNLVQGAWALLLARYSGESDVVFGAVVSGRPPALPDVESMVGMFINTLPMRARVESDTELLSWLKELQAQQVETEQYSYTPLVDIQNWSDVPRGMPLFESIVVFENYPVDASLKERQGTLDVSNVRGIQQTNYPLTAIVVLGDRVSLNINYERSRFDADAIARMLGHLQMLLEGMVLTPVLPISRLPLLTEWEQQQLLVDWNDTQADYPRDLCVHQLFERQVERTPDAVAIVSEDEQLTYKELDRQANQLARHLQALGVRPEVPVGICIERSLDMAIGLLAILKAGGAYVPLDPNYPQERLSFMLSDSQVPVLLTQTHLIEILPAHSAQIVCLDAWEAIARSNTAPCDSGVKPDNLAYVLYTSGSTGKPKGVAIEHRSPVALVSWAREIFTPDRLAGVLASTSICFDLSVFELFVPLCCGGAVILAENALQLPTLSTADRVTLINTVPSAITELLRVNGIPQGVKTVNLAGEPLPIQLVQQLYQQDSIQQVFNLYGPSEDTTYSTFAAIVKGAATTPPIGRPITNTQTYILDRNLQPLPIGVPGELHVGGDGLAREYLNRPELTKEKFIPNPFSFDPQSRPKSRLYKTGDLARYLPDGNIEYIGRIDNQVKIRGFRIELGEVETALLQHPSVLQPVVVAREDEPGKKRLVAYLVCDSDRLPVANDLRQFLKVKLPEYMVPSAFVFLDALPLTPNGKIDRRALPAPEFRPDLEPGFIPPGTEVEQKLAQIWSEVLGVKQIGIRDNFFELGGDSILSLQIIARANQLGIHLTPKQLFAHQTIAELAAVARIGNKIRAEQGLVTGAVPLTPIQRWFFDRERPEAHHFNQSVLLSVPSDLQPELLEQAIQHLASHHDALRLRFDRTENGWEQFNADISTPVPLQLIDLAGKSLEEQQLAIETIGSELQASLNLAESTLMRSALFRLGDDKPGRLLVIIHHLAVDGVSWRILLEDLMTAYQQLNSGGEIHLPPKTTSFKEWANRLTEYAQTPALSAELDYWLVQRDRDAASLPVDLPFSQENNTIASTATVSVSLNAVETLALLQEVPSAYNTQINDVLLAALLQSFARWTGRGSLCIDLEGHGREELFEDADVSRTVGWFTTLFPVLLHLGDEKQPDRVLKSVKEQLRRLPNRGIGYGILRYLSPDAAQLQAVASAPVKFNYLGQIGREELSTEAWQLTQESGGSECSSLGYRSHLLDVSGLVIDGRLQIDWAYSRKIHQHSTIERLAGWFMEALRDTIARCQSPDAVGYTPSDFAKADLSQQELDDLIAEID